MMDLWTAFDRYRFGGSRAMDASPLGFQLDKLRLGLVGVTGGRAGSSEAALDVGDHLLYFFTKILTREEYRVLDTLRTPLEHTHECAQIKEAASRGYVGRWGGVECTCGAVTTYQRRVRDGDLYVHEISNGTDVTRVQLTRSGEHFLRPDRDEETGEPVEGWSWVDGWRPVYPTREQVAESLGVSLSTIKRMIRSSREKWVDAEIEAREHEEAMSACR